jgi:TPR repeat protein
MFLAIAFNFYRSHVKKRGSLSLVIWQVGVLCLLASVNCEAVQPAFQFGYHDIPKMSGNSVLDGLMKRLSLQASEEDRRSALAALQQLADSGDAEAAFRLGRYFHIEDGHRDYAQALFYYNKAIEKGHAWAMSNVGLLYQDGLGVQVDYAIARHYFEQAAAKGSEFGYYNLARQDLIGEGGQQDIKKGLALLETCAQLKKSLCLYNEAALYLTGDFGIPEDYPKGLALAAQAAELGERVASWGMAKLYLTGDDGVPLDIAKGMSILRELSNQGYGLATASLGDLQSDPKLRSEFFSLRFAADDQVSDAIKAALPQDLAKAESYWLAATQQGYCRAFTSLASVYDRGAGVQVDYSKAALYVANAVKCAPNEPLFLFKLGDRMTEAKGIPRDCVRAGNLFYKSLSLGYSQAGANLGYLYDKGCGTILRDDKRAFQIYLACAKAGDPMCQNNVGAMLKHGRGVGEPDYVRSFGWFMISASRGEELARKNLENYKDLFQSDTREQGIKHAEEVAQMIHAGFVDMQALERGDMAY